jgi:two-component system nitrogen regulation sensor histidine kinase NtrY
MKNLLPSFRIQIIVVFLLLLVISILFTRMFFLKSFNSFLQRISQQDVTLQLNRLYDKYAPNLPPGEIEKFKQEIESLMINQSRTDLAVDLYRREVTIYSIYIFVFVLLAVLIIFLLSINLITRPLRRLQAATRALAAGDTDIQVRENRFSPINDLIVSFNQMVREVNRQRQRAIEAEKQLIWKEIARVMAHEIKNPLTPIKLTIERLENKGLKKPDDILPVLTESIGIIKEEVQNLQSLVNRFREFATLPAASKESYSLENQLNEIVRAYQPTFDIELVFENELPPIYADKIQMKQTFVNLIQNAIQAGEPERGKLTITVGTKDSSFSIAFKDNGPGIKAEDMAKIFEPYFTTKRKGTGLGLAVGKRIVENHGGEIMVTSQSTGGTTVTISLPIIATNE